MEFIKLKRVVTIGLRKMESTKWKDTKWKERSGKKRSGKYEVERRVTVEELVADAAEIMRGERIDAAEIMRGERSKEQRRLFGFIVVACRREF